jgi:hypothetical protein
MFITLLRLALDDDRLGNYEQAFQEVVAANTWPVGSFQTSKDEKDQEILAWGKDATTSIEDDVAHRASAAGYAEADRARALAVADAARKDAARLREQLAHPDNIGVHITEPIPERADPMLPAGWTYEKLAALVTIVSTLCGFAGWIIGRTST